MKKWNLFAAIFQIVVGIAAMIAYIVVAASDEPLGKWTITLVLAIAFVMMGIVGMVDFLKSNKSNKTNIQYKVNEERRKESA